MILRRKGFRLPVVPCEWILFLSYTVRTVSKVLRLMAGPALRPLASLRWTADSIVPQAAKSCRPVDPQNLNELGDFAQMAEGVARRFIIAAEEVDVEDIFPRASAHGA